MSTVADLAFGVFIEHMSVNRIVEKAAWMHDVQEVHDELFAEVKEFPCSGCKNCGAMDREILYFDLCYDCGANSGEYHLWDEKFPDEKDILDVPEDRQMSHNPDAHIAHIMRSYTVARCQRCSVVGHVDGNSLCCGCAEVG